MVDTSINLRDELERKTLEALARVVSDFERMAISQAQARLALDILFAATSGLTGGETFNLVSQASAEINAESKRDYARRFFVHPNKKELLLLQYAYGEAEVTIKRGKYPMKSGEVNMWERSSRATFQNEPDPFETAAIRYREYADALLRQGFQEIL